VKAAPLRSDWVAVEARGRGRSFLCDRWVRRQARSAGKEHHVAAMRIDRTRWAYERVSMRYCAGAGLAWRRVVSAAYTRSEAHFIVLCRV
jgi:hypothetical protein